MKAQIIHLTKMKQDFPVLQRKIHGKPLTYLDSAASSLTPQQVVEAMNKYYNEYRANVHRGIYQLSEEATEAYDHAHAVVASFIHAFPEEIIFTRSATESLNLLAYSLTKSFRKGDEVVLTQMEHHSNLVPWQQIAKEKGFSIKYIQVKLDGTLDYEHAKKVITSKTKIVSATYMSNVLGTINDVKRLTKLAHDKKALMIVDAAQAIPHFSVNVRELDVDFLAFSGHKMLGPTGIGVLYGKKQILEKMHPFQYGGGMIKQVTFKDTIFNDLPYKFEAGTPAIAEAIGLAKAVEYLQEKGMNSIREHEKELTAYALRKLQEIPNLILYGPQNPELQGGVISFNLSNIHPHDVAALLDKQGIAVRAGHMCAMPLNKEVLKVNSVCRISFYIYNTKEDIDAAVKALHSVEKVFQ